MRNQALWITAVAVVLAGCKPDDVDGKTGDTAAGPTDTGATDTDTDTGPTDGTDTQVDPAARIHGSWVSEGEDVAPLLAQFGVVRIDATFAADGSYTVDSRDGAGAVVTFTGTYTVDASTTPHGIALEQATPLAASAEGIWQVDASGVLTYEVAQTVPDVGAVPPTPAAGFGSTTGAGIAPGDNVQVFRPAP